MDHRTTTSAMLDTAPNGPHASIISNVEYHVKPKTHRRKGHRGRISVSLWQVLSIFPVW